MVADFGLFSPQVLRIAQMGNQIATIDNTRYTKAVARATAAAIKAGGETQLGIAEKTGIPRTTLARRLSGSSPFTVAELDTIASVLGIPVAALVMPVAKKHAAA